MKGYVKFGSLKPGDKFITLRDALDREHTLLYIKIHPIPKKRKRGEIEMGMGDGEYNALVIFSGESVEMLDVSEVKKVLV